MLQSTCHLHQLPNVESGHVTSRRSNGESTHQLESIGSSVFVQVLGDVPVRYPTSYDSEVGPSLEKDT